MSIILTKPFAQIHNAREITESFVRVLTVWSNADHLVKMRFWNDMSKYIYFDKYLPP